MKKHIVKLTLLTLTCGILFMGESCDMPRPSSDTIQSTQQETILQEGTARTGMPAIRNFRERKMLKNILELRDQDGIITYTYLENMNPTIVKGHTALGGKLTYLGESIGYGIPYATQYTNPQKKLTGYQSITTIPQADPNGLFSPASAEGTWVLLKDPSGSSVRPTYIEPRVLVSPFQLPMD